LINQKVLIHAEAIVEEGVTIGEGTRVYAFTHVLGGACIGKDCNLNDHVFVENDVWIGDRVTIKSGVQLWDGVRIEDDVFLGPNATFTNDKFPRSKVYPKRFKKTIVRNGASIGANATILPNVTIGSSAMVGAGSVVTRDVPSRAIVTGNPARITGYVGTDEKQVPAAGQERPLEQSRIEGVNLYKLQHVKDLRGDLSAIEWEQQLPFSPKRAFFVYNVPSTRVRGEHAHKLCHQFLLCLNGTVAVVVDNGEFREEFHLTEAHVGIHIPPKVWGVQYKYSPGAVLFVLASHEYDPADYIRDYDEYLAYIKQ